MAAITNTTWRWTSVLLIAVSFGCFAVRGQFDDGNSDGYDPNNGGYYQSQSQCTQTTCCAYQNGCYPAACGLTSDYQRDYGPGSNVPGGPAFFAPPKHNPTTTSNFPSHNPTQPSFPFQKPSRPNFPSRRPTGPNFPTRTPTRRQSGGSSHQTTGHRRTTRFSN